MSLTTTHVLPVFVLSDGCRCGADSLMAVYRTRDERDVALAEAQAQLGNTGHEFVWTDRQGYGLQVTARHTHLPGR
jgi:hypothetical protein